MMENFQKQINNLAVQIYHACKVVKIRREIKG